MKTTILKIVIIILLLIAVILFNLWALKNSSYLVKTIAVFINIILFLSTPFNLIFKDRKPRK
jgi:uncharacterized protein YacL